ncbi:dTMP kinase [Haloglycomyces albus]|uniref:dTMP kinase n=1 Tax=Haloglycomyces albus TaxID=526067 RepID=UPI0004AD0627|nr:hypothetical protein [Haloglycomyces albus]
MKPEPNSSKRVILLGIDGVGKTSQATALAERLRQEGSKVELYTRPGLSYLPEADAITPDNRYDLAQRVTQGISASASNDVDWWVADRYSLSHIALDSMQDRPDPDGLRDCYRSLPTPDLVVWLEASIEECLARQVQRGGDVDSRAYLEGLRDGFWSLPESNSFEVIDAERAFDTVREDIWSAVSRLDPAAASHPTFHGQRH